MDGRSETLIRARWLIIVLIILLALAADSYGKGQKKSGPSASGIECTVLIGPVCPAEQRDKPCLDQPYDASVTVTLASSGRKVLTVRSGRDGKFRVILAPGTYRLIPNSPNRGSPPYADPQTVKVERGKYANVIIKYDSGIR